MLPEMLPYFHDFYGDLSSIDNFAGKVATKLTEAREMVAAFRGAEPDEIIFTGCGTESRASILGHGRPWKLAAQRPATAYVRIRQLRDGPEGAIQEQIPNIPISGGKTEPLPNTSNVSFQCVGSEAILLLLDQLGTCASSASGRTSWSTESSHILGVMTVPYAVARGAVPFSLSMYHTAGETDCAPENLSLTVRRVREMAPNEKAQSAYGNVQWLKERNLDKFTN